MQDVPAIFDLNLVQFPRDAPKLVLLHGLGGTHRYWQFGLEKLKSRYHVIIIDLLGFGDSAKPWKIYSKELHLRALHATLSHFGEFLLVGHSLGAALSIAYAAKYPEQVKGLVLMSLPLFKSKPEAYNWMRRTPSGWLMTNMLVAALTCIVTRRVAGKLLPYFLKEFPREIVDDLVKHNFMSSTTSLWQVLYNQSIFDDILRLDKQSAIRCIHAVNDATAPYEPVKELCNKQVEWQLTSLPLSDHHPWLWDHAACEEVILDALQSVFSETVHKGPALETTTID